MTYWLFEPQVDGEKLKDIFQFYTIVGKSHFNRLKMGVVLSLVFMTNQDRRFIKYLVNSWQTKKKSSAYKQLATIFSTGIGRTLQGIGDRIF